MHQPRKFRRCTPVGYLPAVITLRAWWWRIVLALAAVGVSYRPFRETDLYWHLALGRAVLRAHSRVVREPYALGDFSPTCTAQEWLWDIAIELLWRFGGGVAVAVLVLAVSAGLALALPAMLSDFAPADSSSDPTLPESPVDRHSATLLVAPLVIALGLARLRERPESLALLLIPVAVLLARRFARADTPSTQLRAGLPLAATEVFWAQVHPTFVLVPAITLAVLAPTWRSPSGRRSLRVHALLFIALTLGLLTSAHGLAFAHNIAVHVHGDAVAHLRDMAQPAWATFDPLSSVFGPLYAGLWIVGLVGLAVRRRVSLPALALGILSLALVVSAVRGLSPGGILLGPFALEGSVGLASLLRRSLSLGARRLPLGVFGILGVLAFARAAVRLDEQNGPIGHLGVPPGWFPTGIARTLARSPVGTRVFTDFFSGAPIGYLLDGRVRVSMDSRIPLYFDDTAYAVARDAWRDGTALDNTLDRYRADAAVLARSEGTCPLLAALPGWTAVAIDARFTLFARRDGPLGAPGVRGLSPCGSAYLADNACTDLDALDASIRAAASVDDPAFIGYLRAARGVTCHATGPALARDVRAIPDAYAALGYARARDVLLARMLVSTGQGESAADLLDPWVAQGDLPALALDAQALSRDLPRLRDVMQTVARRLDDATPTELRAGLARLCTALHDPECASFEGVRAAALGDASVVPSLCYVSRAHPSALARRDAARWIDEVRNRTHEALPCPPIPDP